MNYEKMTKAELISKLRSLESDIENTGCSEEETTLKRAGEEIRKLSQALEESPGIFVITDAKGDIEFVNPRFTQLTGYTTEETIGRNPRILKSGKTTTEEFKRLWEAITTGGTWKGELCNKKKNGELYWESASISSMNNPDGVISNFIKVAEDVTERKQAEEKIKKLNETLEQRVLERTEELSKAIKEIKSSEARFRSILSSLYEAAIIVYDYDGKITSFWGTPEMDKRYGMRAVDAIGRSVRDFAPPEQAEQLITKVRHIIETGTKVIYEHAISVPEGNFWLETSLSPMCDQKGAITAVVGFMRDITERKQTEEKARTKNSYLKLLQVAAVTANEASEIKDAFLPILSQICNYTGWEIGHAYAISENNPDLLKPTEVWCIEEQKQYLEFCRVTKITDFTRGVGLPGRVLASSKPHWIVDVTKDGNFLRKQIALDLNIKSGIAFPVMVGHSVVAVLEFFTTKEEVPDQQFMEIMADVGTQLGRTVERKQAEETLLQSEKMKAMGIMTAGVAHEFNNILAVISCNAQLLEEAHRSDKELMNTLRTICRMADDGAEIVDRMYDFTSIRKDTSRYVNVDLHDLTKEVIGFTMPRWKEMAHADGITYQIVWKGIKALPPVMGNTSELREVILNIINNALDAMPKGGTITVKSRHIRPPADRARSNGLMAGQVARKEKTASEIRNPKSKVKSGFVEITFADTGIGMTEEVRKRLFDPFFTTRSPVGTGLGMSVSYGIVTRHGGMINMESKPGKGTEIKLTLPVSGKSIRHVAAPGQNEKSNINNLSILVVDDKKEICESLGNIFKDDGHKVRSLNRGDEAIRLLKENSYDLLVCDLVMPGVNGRYIVNAVKMMKKRPKIGLITGWKYKMDDAKKEGLEVDFIVKKPFNLARLRRDINNAFN